MNGKSAVEVERQHALGALERAPPHVEPPLPRITAGEQVSGLVRYKPQAIAVCNAFQKAINKHFVKANLVFHGLPLYAPMLRRAISMR